ncbi:MAG TPA: hypothetical protein VH092_39100 [Urbifossiella sp.]|nr:hypothetical protein [Urbifossiella sp.]
MNLPFTPEDIGDGEVVALLRRFPSDTPAHRHAQALLAAYQRCVLKAIRACDPGTPIAEKVDLWEAHRAVLITELEDLFATLTVAGGAA